MKKRIFIATLLFSCVSAFGQVSKTEIKRIFEEAEKIYQSGNYAASLAYIKNEAGTAANTSDSLIYLRIMNLDKMYRSNFQQTTELEAAFKLFFARANRNTFPEIKYSEVSASYTQFLGFKERDKMYYDSVTRVFDINNTAKLVPVKTSVTNYLSVFPNTYYAKEHNETISKIDTKLTELANLRKKQIQDSTFKARIKSVGKKISLNVGYGIPNTTSGIFRPFKDKAGIISFFNGTGTTSLNEKFSLNLSLAEAMINLSTTNRFKIGINWSVFDGEMTRFDWSADTILNTSEQGGNEISNVTLLKVGTRIGLIAVGMVAKRMAVGVYYSARPGVQFFTNPFYFRAPNGTGVERFEISHEIANFQLTNEVGLKLYLFERTFASVFYHFGNHSWKSVFNNLSNPNSGTTKTEAEYSFKTIGLRLGF